MQEQINLYYNSFSNCAQRVMLLLEEKQLNYKKHPVDLIRSGQLKGSFLKVNPKGRVPAMLYKGQYYDESCDIMYLLESEFNDSVFIPVDKNQQQLMRRFVQSAKDSHGCIKDYVYATGCGRLPTDKELSLYDKIDPANAAFHHDRRAQKVGCDLKKASARVRLDFLKINHALDGQDWIAGEFSLADMAWFPNTVILRQMGYDFSEMENVCRWMHQMEQRDSYKNGFGKDIGSVPNWVIRSFLRLKRRFQPNRR